MRPLLLVPVSIAATFVLAACGVFGGDDNKSSTSGDFYKGQVTVGLTDNIPTTGGYTPQNIYNPAVRQIIAVVQIENAKAGTKVLGRWYQMGTIQQKIENVTPVGTLVSEAEFTMRDDAIVKESGRGGGRLSLQPVAALPEDSYMLQVFIDGKLAKTAPFVVSRLVPGPAAAPAAAPPAAPPAASTPAAATPTPVR